MSAGEPAEYMNGYFECMNGPPGCGGAVEVREGGFLLCDRHWAARPPRRNYPPVGGWSERELREIDARVGQRRREQAEQAERNRLKPGDTSPWPQAQGN